MCELFGASSNRQTDCTGLLQEFYSHGTSNPHGWGIAMFRGNEFYLNKEPTPSVSSSGLKNLLSSPIEAQLLLAHIRLATKGSIEYLNTHPFLQEDRSGRTWILIHNGTIFECDELEPYVKRQEGNTDSERLLLYLIDQLDEESRKLGRALQEEDRIRVVEEVLKTVTPGNKVNLLLTDGTMLYVHSNYRASLYQRNDGDTVWISTFPLDENEWEELPLNTLRVFRGNTLRHQGADHGNEYFDSEEKMKLLYLDFANL